MNPATESPNPTDGEHMADEPTGSPAAQCGWVKLFHSSGALVTLPVPGPPFAGEPYNYAAAHAGISAAIAAGFSVNLPGLEAGEEKQEVGYVLRREKSNDDGTSTPVIDLYSPHDYVTFKVVSVYLNTDDDVSQFERAAGVSLDSLQCFPGTAAPERGKSKQSDKFIVKTLRRFVAVIGANPKYDPKLAEAATKEKPYMVAKRKLVRWADVENGQPSPAMVEGNGKPPAAKIDPPKDKPQPGRSVIDQAAVDGWKRYLANEPSCTALSHACRDLSAIGSEHTRRACWRLIKQYADLQGWEFDDSSKNFVEPKDVTEEAAAPF